MTGANKEGFRNLQISAGEFWSARASLTRRSLGEGGARNAIGKECFESVETGRESFERLGIAAKIEMACRKL
jgi:hypothetical protein